MPNPYPGHVSKIAQEFITILEKYYPELTKKVFDPYGYPTNVGSPALIRAEMCIYIELMKAGVFNDALV